MIGFCDFTTLNSVSISQFALNMTLLSKADGNLVSRDGEFVPFYNLNSIDYDINLTTVYIVADKIWVRIKNGEVL